jgi:hypothetical protein
MDWRSSQNAPAGRHGCCAAAADVIAAAAARSDQALLLAAIFLSVIFHIGPGVVVHVALIVAILALFKAPLLLAVLVALPAAPLVPRVALTMRLLTISGVALTVALRAALVTAVVLRVALPVALGMPLIVVSMAA